MRSVSFYKGQEVAKAFKKRTLWTNLGRVVPAYTAAPHFSDIARDRKNGRKKYK